MSKIKTFCFSLVAFSCIGLVGYGQGKKSKGDDYFFQYQYDQAVMAYESEMLKGTLTPEQFLNLADAYFNTDNFEKASDTYFQLFEQEIPIGNHHFNKMLQSFAKSSREERLRALIAAKNSNFEQEFLENMEFNSQLLNDSNSASATEFNIFNLNGNSPQADFAPAFYGDTLLFSSGRSQDKKHRYIPSGEGYLNIYVGSIVDEGQLELATPYTQIPSSNYHKATPYYSERLQGIFYVLSNTLNGELAFDENGKNALAIGMQLKNGSHQLLLKDLSTSFYYPFYDEQNERLYFSANFENGYGGTDIYYVRTNRGQIMSAPINLGPRINSPGNEIAPYIFDDSFYFASDVFYGLGGMDIYKSNLEANTFSIPVNLGNGINSPEDDFGLIIRDYGEGMLGYFASNRPGGKGNDDLYGFKVDQKPGLRTLTFKGKVAKLNNPSEIVDKVTIRLLDSEGSVLAETFASDDGLYRMEIPWKEDVRLVATKNRFSTFEKVFGEEDLMNLEDEDLDIAIASYDDLVEEKEEQTVVKLDEFYFARNGTQLTTEIKNELDKVISFVQGFPEAQLRIETHTDSRGGSSTNFRLTQRRSDEVKNYLIQNGVPTDNILYSIGYGEDKILNNCTNGVYCLEFLHKKNQRTLIVVLNDNVLFN